MSPVAPSVLSCVIHSVTNWSTEPAYWGSQEDHYYLVRQTFSVSDAASYGGSILTFGFTSGNSSEPSLIFLNGQEVTNGAILGGDGVYRISIAGQLRPGQNVLALYAVPESPSVTDPANNRCSSLNFSATIRTSMTATQTSIPTPLTPLKSDTSTKIYDLGSTPGSTPQGWNTVGFDESTWDHLSPVAPSVLSCVVHSVTNWSTTPAYWGSQGDHYYLVRQTFSVPHATSYGGSILTLGFTSGSSSDTLQVYLNGQQITTGATLGGDGIYRISIGAYLRPGQNVLALYAVPESSSTDSANNRCSALYFEATLRVGQHL